MDAKELTKVVNNQSSEIIELKKQVDYLTQEVEKLRLLMDDIKYDVMDLQRRKQNERQSNQYRSSK